MTFGSPFSKKEFVGSEKLNQWLVPTGVILPYAGVVAPTGWLLCAGGIVSRSQFPDLFTLIGETFGAGDGSTTFGLPDMRGRVGIGMDNLGGNSADVMTHANADSLGGVEGSEEHTLTITEMPFHQHTINFQADADITGSSVRLRSTGGAGTDKVQGTGGGVSHRNDQPWIAMGSIIKI